MIRAALRLLVVLGSTAALAVFALAAYGHLETERPADPMEAAILERAERLAHRQPVYVEREAPGPALMPGLPLAASALGGEFGPGLRELRLLALGLVLALAGLVAATVRIETASWTLALAGAGFVLAGHGFLAVPAGGVRPETAMLVLALAGFLVLRLTSGVPGAMLAALLLAAGFFVDQQAGWFLAAAYVAVAMEDNRQLVAYALVAGLAVAGGYLLLSRLFGSWFNYEAWDAPLAALRWSAAAPARYVGVVLLGTLGIWTLAALLSCAMPVQQWYGKSGLWLHLFAASVLAGILATQSAASGAVAVLPVLVALSVLGPISLQRVARHLAAWPGSDRRAGESVALAAVALQFLAFFASVPASRWLP